MPLTNAALARRLDVLTLLAEGRPYVEIAERVGLSTRSVCRVAALARLNAAVPSHQLPASLQLALEREHSSRRRAALLHDLTRLAVEKARERRRALRLLRRSVHSEPVIESSPAGVHSTNTPSQSTPPRTAIQVRPGLGGALGPPGDDEWLRRAAAHALSQLRQFK